MPTSSSKDLGLSAAMIPGTIPPTNTDVLWLDITTNPSVKKYHDPNDGLWKPLIAINQIIGNGITSISLGKQIVFVSTDGNDYTGAVGDLSKSFNTVGGAYAYAKTLLPTVLNQIIIAVYPGTYLENLIMDTDYINIMSATPQNVLYNDGLAALNGVSFDVLKRKYIINGTVTIMTANVNIKGIDIRTLVIKPLTTSAILIENMVCQTISNPVSATSLKASFFDVHAESFLNSDTQTDLVGSFIMCGSNTAFRSGIATHTGDTWLGGVVNSYFELCYGGDGSIGGLGGYVNNATILNCNFGNNCMSTIDNSNLNNVILGNICVKSTTNTNFSKITGGSDCFRDFTDAIIQDCIFGVDFGKNGTLTFISGNLDNVTSDYTNGFASGRPFWGKMRRMFIRSTNAANSALNIATPVDSGVNRQPSTIEHSTILFCTTDPTTKSTIDGTFAYVSYCKFNVEYTVVNVLGSDNDSNNIVNTNLCNYVTTICPLPTLFTLVTSSFSTGTGPIDFVFNYQMSVARAGSQIEVIDPNNAVTIVNFVGNDGGSSAGTMTIHEDLPIAGAYKFRLRTVCSYDGLGAVSSSSSWTVQITANVTNSTRATAWRAKAPTVYCIMNSLPQNPVYAVLSQESPTSDDNTSTSPPYHERTIRNYDKLRLSFFSDAGLSTPLNMVSQDFVAFLRVKQVYSYSIYDNTNDTNTRNSGFTQVIESVNSYNFTGISGTSVLINSGFDFIVSYETRDTTSFSGASVDRQTELVTTTYALFAPNQIYNSQTGYKEWTTLEQYYTDNSAATGTTKPNVFGDPNYIAPVSDTSLCPVATPSTTISLGAQLYVTTVNFVTGATTKAPDLGGIYDSQGGGDIFIVQSFKGQPTTLSVNVTTYYTGAVTTPGKVQVVITHDGGTVTTIPVNRGVLTTLGTFIDITFVSISNF